MGASAPAPHFLYFISLEKAVIIRIAGAGRSMKLNRVADLVWIVAITLREAALPDGKLSPSRLEPPSLKDLSVNQGNLQPAAFLPLFYKTLRYSCRTPKQPCLPTPNSQLPTPNSQLPTPNSQLPTPNSQLPTPNSQLPTPNSQLPTPIATPAELYR